MVPVWRAATVIVAVAIACHGAGVVAAEDGPLPVDDLSRFESASADPGLSVAVERAGGRLRPGRDTTYTITVENRSDAAEPVTVRVSVPPWMSEVTSHQAEFSDGYVHWPVTVEPGAPARLQLTGVYRYPEQRDTRQAGPVRVAFTACAWDDDDGQPIACATEVSQLERRAAGWVWPLVTGAAATLLAITGVVLLVRWRRRRSRRASSRPTPAPPAAA